MERQPIWLVLTSSTYFLLTLVSPLTGLLQYYPNCLYSTLYTSLCMDLNHGLIQRGEKVANFLIYRWSNNTSRQLRSLICSPLYSMKGVESPHDDTFQVPRKDSALSIYSLYSIKEVPTTLISSYYSLASLC